MFEQAFRANKHFAYATATSGTFSLMLIAIAAYTTVTWFIVQSYQFVFPLTNTSY